MYGGDVLKVALLKHRVFKHHGLHLQVEEPSKEVIPFQLKVLFCGVILVLHCRFGGTASPENGGSQNTYLSLK